MSTIDRGPLPTMSVRALPEHQAFIRDIARALRDRPELEAGFRRLIEDDGEAEAPAAIPAAGAGHRALLDATMATLRDIPEAAASLSRWLAMETLGDAPAPNPNEFPKWVNGRVCNNIREERRSLALGPAAPETPRPPNDLERAAQSIDARLRESNARVGYLEPASDKFFHGR